MKRQYNRHTVKRNLCSELNLVAQLPYDLEVKPVHSLTSFYTPEEEEQMDNVMKPNTRKVLYTMLGVDKRYRNCEDEDTEYHII